MAGQMGLLINQSAAMAAQIDRLTAEVASLKEAAGVNESAGQVVMDEELREEEHEQQPGNT